MDMSPYCVLTSLQRRRIIIQAVFLQIGTVRPTSRKYHYQALENAPEKHGYIFLGNALDFHLSPMAARTRSQIVGLQRSTVGNAKIDKFCPAAAGVKPIT
jgi:hypothetical protein